MGLIHLPIPSLIMVNETEERRFLPSADTSVYTVFSKSGLPKQAADATSPYHCMANSYFCFLIASSECSRCCRMKQKSQTHANI